MRAARWLLWLLSAILALPGAAALAANLQISPVMIILRAGQGAAGISLQNLGEAPVYGQVRVFRWDQNGAGDELSATQDVVASPPIVQIAARSSQVIRLVRRSDQPSTSELSYRILIDEIPGADQPATSGVDIRLQYSVPLFVLPPDEAGAPVLAWTCFRQDGEWMLRVNNSGRQRAQIGALTLVNPAGQSFVVSEGLFGYVLAGRTRVWRLPPALGKADLHGALTVRATINTKPQSATTAAP